MTDQSKNYDWLIEEVIPSYNIISKLRLLTEHWSVRWVSKNDFSRQPLLGFVSTET